MINLTFSNRFGSTPDIIVRSPGRINLLGEHTDYNDGFVLPAAINRAVYCAVSLRNDHIISLYAKEFDEQHLFHVDEIGPSGNWTDYVIGVVDQLIKRGVSVKGFNLVLDGDIPIGAGLSSSAAVECAVVYALDSLLDLGLDKIDMVKIAQKAEHQYAGVLCGIMDQFASMFGKENQVISLDCRSLDYEYFPFLLEGYQVVLFDTMVKHNLASSEYNLRRQQCELGVQAINKNFPFVKSLRDATVDMLNESVDQHHVVYARCLYVIQENERLQTACVDLKEGRMKEFGAKMFETHKGLSELYQVSCKELDFLVNQLKDDPNVLGARMMGGGFGGCTINLIKGTAVDDIIHTISENYLRVFNANLKTYKVSLQGGTSIIERKISK